jgi:hypothetical protein
MSIRLLPDVRAVKASGERWPGALSIKLRLALIQTLAQSVSLTDDRHASFH